MKKVLKIDSEGFFIEDVILQDGKAIPSDCTEYQCPNGFYKPKLEGTIWIEGLTQAEIDAIKNIPAPKTDIELLQEQLVASQTLALQTSSDFQSFMDYMFINDTNLPQ